MSNKLKCSLCEKLATVHLTQIINNKIQKIDLCDSCAEKKGVADTEGFSVADMLASSKTLNDSSQNSCIKCGMELVHFRKSGRFGCADCYRVFSSILKPILLEMHVGSIHNGKYPKNGLSLVNERNQKNDLKAKMEQAILDEDYEAAAKYRDEIVKISNVNSTTKDTKHEN